MVIDPERGEVTVSGAGHPAADAGAGCAAMPASSSCPGSVPLGTDKVPRYENVDGRPRPGLKLILFSDGVVERPGEGLEMRMVELREAAGRAGQDPEASARRSWTRCSPTGRGATMPRCSPSPPLPLSTRSSSRCQRTSIPPDAATGPAALARRAGGSEREVDELALACSEACANAIEHAYSPPAGRVQLEATVGDDRTAHLTISDSGRWRPPRGANRGRGMLLMEGLTDAVDVVRRDGGTSVRLTRRLGEPST